ncbi:hypothetical protein VTO42DRAFT_4924 [Malbranchea cinnamomea]
MPVDKRKVGVFGAAVALRVLLIVLFPGLPDLLTGRVEVSTPLSSFKRLQEGLFLYTRHVSPYDGGVFHQAPILLPIFSLLPQSSHPLISGLVFTLLDVLNANALLNISDSGEAVSTRLYTSPRKHIRWDGVAIAAGYLFNPFTIASCLGRSTNAFTNAAIMHAVLHAIAGSSANSMLALGFASYLSLYPILLLPPVVLLCFDRRVTRTKTSSTGILPFLLKHALVLVASIAALLVVSYFITGQSWDFIPATYGVQLLVPDLTPNTGLWWYFLIEIFDPFREFFLGVFWLHLAGYVGGVTIRLRRQPLFAITTLLGLFALFKPYPSISDVSIFLAFLPLYRHVFPLMRYTFFAVSVLLYASLLGPIFYHLWIYAGSGNANFFYAITLVWSLGLAILIADSLFAVLRDEWETERPEMRGKDVKRI